MKRNALTSLILVVAMLISMFSMVVGTEAATTKGTVSISSASVKAGSTVTLPIRIRNNPGIVALKALIEYDDDYLSITKVEDQEIMGDALHQNDLSKNPFTFTWMDALSEENITTNGILVNVTFKVKSTAPNGTYKIDLSLDEAAAIYNSDLDTKDIKSSFTVTDGIITVTGGTTAVEDEEEEDDVAEPAIKASSTTVAQGKEFSLTLTLTNNPGLVSLRTELDYNDDYFKVVKVTDAGILGTKYFSDDLTNSPLELFWTKPLNSNITKNGKIVTVTFECDEDTPAGKYKFTPKLDEADVVNYKLQEIGDNFELTAGTVTVKKATAADEKDEEVEIDGDEPVIKASSVTAVRGTQFNVTLNLGNNPGFVSLRTELEYDDDYFKVVKITDGGLLGTKYFSDNLTNSPLELFWTNPLKSNITKNGKIVTVTFESKANTPAGKYKFTPKLDTADVVNYKLQEIGDDFECVDGTVTIVTSSSAVTTGKPNIKVSDATAKPGDTFDVTLTLSNNPGLISLRTMLEFNDNYFEIAKITDGGLLGTKYFGDAYDESPFELYWTNPLLKTDNVKNGKIATVTFVVKDNVPEGKYSIGLSSDDGDILNYSLDELGDEFTFTAGLVTVGADDETKPVGSEYSVTLYGNTVSIVLPVTSVSYGDGMLAVLQESLLEKALAEAAKSYPGKQINIKAVYSNRTDGDLVINIDNSYAEKMKNVESFTLETYKAVMKFDNPAITEMANADTIVQFIFKDDVPKDKLDSLVSAEYKYYDVASSVNFTKGNITVTLPYEAASDIVGKYAVVYAFDGEKLENIGSSITYTPGKMTFNTKNIDSYVVTTKELGFKDIKNHWARDNINYVAIRGIFNGSSETTFSPDAELSRGMLVTVLGRLEQIDVSGYNCMFEDVDKNLYYAPYIEWARKNGIVGGRTESQFDPDASVTRQEMAVIISRYLEKYKGKTLSAVARTFSDAAKIPSWSKTDIYKVSNAGIITGVGTEFQPANKATRAQAATILRRIVEFLD